MSCQQTLVRLVRLLVNDVKTGSGTDLVIRLLQSREEISGNYSLKINPKIGRLPVAQSPNFYT
jgi:hypothetical protein